MDILEQFKTYLKVKDYSRIYINPVYLFLSYCSDKGIDYKQLTYQNYQDFLLHLKEKGNKNGYINNFLKGIRCLYSFLKESGQLEDEKVYKIIESFKLLPVAQEIKDFITKDELKGIISKALTYSYPMSPERIRAILYFMFYTGLRRDEVINMKRQEINLAERTATVRVPTKNKKERVVFFPPIVAEYLQAYFDLEAEETNAFNLSVNKIKAFFVFINHFAPKNKHISSHTMRHSFANMLARAGIDVRVAQKLLGHKSITSTLIYYDPDKDIIQELYTKKIKG